MALKPMEQETLKWKPGAQCALFIRKERKWTDGEIVGVHGELVKVRCGDQVHEVQCDDPDLRVKSQSLRLVPFSAIKKLEMAAMKQPVIAQWLQSTLSSSDHPELQQALNTNNKSSVHL